VKFRGDILRNGQVVVRDVSGEIQIPVLAAPAVVDIRGFFDVRAGTAMPLLFGMYELRIDDGRLIPIDGIALPIAAVCSPGTATFAAFYAHR
jgi:hypothetical protein